MEWKKTECSVNTLEGIFLRNIGAKDMAEVQEWETKAEQGTYHIAQLKEAVDFALDFKDKTVTICGDYDADGITATTILVLSLRQSGFKDVRYRIPKRFSEGFGLNTTMIDEIDSGLVITCDNGVAQRQVIDYAKQKGLSVIVTDHHLPETDENGTPLLPVADFIIDPNAIDGSADFNGYCGAGIAYRFARELLSRCTEAEESIMDYILSLAAIGTVADVMELRQENRYIVKQGMKNLITNQCVYTGLKGLTTALGLTATVCASDIGFKIGPTVNASSRMQDDGAKTVVELLLTKAPIESVIEMARKFVENNELRKSVERDAIEQADRQLKENDMENDVPLIFRLRGIGDGIIGLVAGRMCERFQRPVIVFTEEEGKPLKGSARACEGYHMKKALDKCKNLLMRYGGHAGAAGLSLDKDNFDEFCRQMKETADFKPVEKECEWYDAQIYASQVPDAIKALERYAPFGTGNPEFVFRIKQFKVIPYSGKYFRILGANGTAAKVTSSKADAIGFDMAEKLSKYEKMDELELLGSLSNNYFGGTIRAQVEFKDFIVCEAQATTTPLATRLQRISQQKRSL